MVSNARRKIWFPFEVRFRPSEAMNGVVVIALGIILCLVGRCGAFRVVADNTSFPYDEDRFSLVLPSPRVRFMCEEPKYPFYGDLVVSDGRHPSGNLTDKILLHRLRNGQFVEGLCEELKDRGLRALVIVFNSETAHPGMTQYARSRRHLPHQPFPVFEITKLQNDSLEFWFENSTDGIVTVAFDREDKNEWDPIYLDWIPPFAWVIVVLSSMILICAVYKLTLHIIRDGFLLNVPQLVLWMNVISNLIRVSSLIVDPFGGHGIYLYWWVQISTTTPIPFLVTASLLMTFYWHELILRFRQMNSFLDESLIAFVVVIVIIFGFEFATSLARALGAIVALLVFTTGLVYAVVICSLLIFFLVTRTRLHRVFHRINKRIAAGAPRDTKDKTGKHQKRLHTTSNIIVATGVFLLIYLVFLLTISAGHVFWIPKGFFTLMVGSISSSVILSGLQVLLIRPPHRPWRWIFCGLFMKDPGSLLDEKDRTSSKNLSYNESSDRTAPKSELESKASSNGKSEV